MDKQRGSLLKGFIIYLVVSFGLFVLVVEISKKVQSPIEATANDFFDAVRDRHFSQAYSMLSKRAKYELTHYDFNNFLKKYDFYQYKSSNWKSIEEKDENAMVTGHVVLNTGQYLKVNIRFTLESTEKAIVKGKTINLGKLPFSDKFRVWKIDSIQVYD